MSEQVFYFIIGLIAGFFLIFLFRDLILRPVFMSMVSFEGARPDSKSMEFLDAEVDKLIKLTALNGEFLDELIAESEEAGILDPLTKDRLLNLKENLYAKVNALNASMGNYDDLDVYK